MEQFEQSLYRAERKLLLAQQAEIKATETGPAGAFESKKLINSALKLIGLGEEAPASPKTDDKLVDALFTLVGKAGRTLCRHRF